MGMRSELSLAILISKHEARYKAIDEPETDTVQYKLVCKTCGVLDKPNHIHLARVLTDEGFIKEFTSE